MSQSSSVAITNPRRVVSKALTGTACTGATTAAIDIPAKTFVPPWGVSLYVVATSQGGSGITGVGDGNSNDGWIDATACDEGTVAGIYTGTDGYADQGYYYSSADSIDITWSGSATAGVVYVTAELWDWEDMDVASS